MLGTDHHGIADGENPVKKSIKKVVLRGFLFLIAGLAAAALSWYTAPECVRASPGCVDIGFCPAVNKSSPTLECRDNIQVKNCMKSCGCCTESPEGWCPNKVPNLQSIFVGNALYFGELLAFWVIFNVIIYWRLCCSPSTASKKKMTVLISIATVWTLLVMACIWVMYGLTDCLDKFRGVSDVLFAVSVCCFFFGSLCILFAFVSFPGIASYGALLANMAEKRRRSDPDILVLDVSADRARRFLVEEQQRDAELTVQISRSSCAQCCRVFAFLEVLLVAVLFTIGVIFGGLKPDVATREVCFDIGFFLIFISFAIYVRILRSKAYLDNQKHRGEQQWLQELQCPQQLLLFFNADFNVPTAMQGEPGSMAAKSMISFGTRRAFMFAPVSQTANAPGALTRTTHTRILHAEGQADGVLEFKVVVHRRSPGLLQSDVRTEAVARIPLEPHHVAQVRAWLEERRAIFQFETAPEVELLEPEP